MRVSFFSVLALSATGVVADLTTNWEKLALSLNLLELNLNEDRGRLDKYWMLAQEQNADGNALNGTQAKVAKELYDRIWLANGLQIAAMSDLRSFLFYPQKDPVTYYQPGERSVESLDTHLPEGMLETQGVFDDKDSVRPITDIPGCKPCAVNW
ncbi:hypothetical protein GGS26DRAFT_592769 [Hypomontagnella submonticulosa]|nr:hypothetical protein GGS26DRAFT_592769 [Hypomontagnella submonticulosa]